MTATMKRPVFAIGAAAVLVACGGSGGKTPSIRPFDLNNLPPGTPSFEPDPDDPSCPDLTDHPGDCFALEPPEPGEGYQVRYGPNDYDDPDEVASFVIPPGWEGVDCMYRVLDNEETFHFQSYDVAARPGMHHIILYAASSDSIVDGMRDDCSAKNHGSQLLGVLHGGIGGGLFEYPLSGERAPENAGLATAVAPRQAIAFELHAINSLIDQPVLRESWANFYVMPPEEVTELAGQIVFNGGLGMKIPPNATEVIDTQCTAPSAEVRVTEFFGHMHAHGQRFSAFKTGTDGSRTLIYESYDWFELDRREFNSVVQNPTPEYQSGQDGAFSGVLTIGPGERLDYECEMYNSETYDLVYALGAYTAEMCNLFGAYAPDLGYAWTCAGE
jgi:hypothetical protein